MTNKEMERALKSIGIWLVSCESTGKKSNFSYWFIYFNDSDNCIHVETDGTNGGSNKAWQCRLAKEKAIEIRYNQEFKG